MKFIIPYNEELDLQTIQLKFMLTYYPEMDTSDGKLYDFFFFSIGPEYVALEKDIFVYDAFTIKQKEENNKTVIKTRRRLNKWFNNPLNVSPFLLVNYFVCGDFYEDVPRNFKTFLMRHYGYKEEDIIINESWKEKLGKYNKYFSIWLGVSLLILGLATYLMVLFTDMFEDKIWNFVETHDNIYFSDIQLGFFWMVFVILSGLAAILLRRKAIQKMKGISNKVELDTEKK
jgi:hypothetical protein